MPSRKKAISRANETQSTLHVRVSRATELIWEGEARSISSTNADGPFDILPLHANFITLVKDAPIFVVEADGEKKSFEFTQSVLYVKSNVAKIYADVA